MDTAPNLKNNKDNSPHNELLLFFDSALFLFSRELTQDQMKASLHVHLFCLPLFFHETHSPLVFLHHPPLVFFFPTNFIGSPSMSSYVKPSSKVSTTIS